MVQHSTTGAQPHFTEQADDGPALYGQGKNLFVCLFILRVIKRLDSLISLDRQADDDPTLISRGIFSVCQQASGQPHFTGQTDDGLATLGPLSASDLRDGTASSYIT